MKKLILLAAVALLAGSSLSSCKLFRPTETCPAYGKAPVEVEQNSDQKS